MVLVEVNKEKFDIAKSMIIMLDWNGRAVENWCSVLSWNKLCLIYNFCLHFGFCDNMWSLHPKLCYLIVESKWWDRWWSLIELREAVSLNAWKLLVCFNWIYCKKCFLFKLSFVLVGWYGSVLPMF